MTDIVDTYFAGTAALLKYFGISYTDADFEDQRGHFWTIHGDCLVFSYAARKAPLTADLIKTGQHCRFSVLEGPHTTDAHTAVLVDSQQGYKFWAVLNNDNRQALPEGVEDWL